MPKRLTGEVCGRTARSGEFSENSPHLQGGFEEEKSKKKSKKKNLHNLRVPLGFY
jgi:hypothetical protein